METQKLSLTLPITIVPSCDGNKLTSNTVCDYNTALLKYVRLMHQKGMPCIETYRFRDKIFTEKKNVFITVQTKWKSD